MEAPASETASAEHSESAAPQPSLVEIQERIARMKASRSVLNRPGQKRLKVKELINTVRP